MYRYSGGVNWHGVVALVAGMGTAALCVDTDLYLGPVARAPAGVDLSLPVVVPGGLYAPLLRNRVSPALTEA